MSLINSRDDMTGKIDLVARQLKVLEETNKKNAMENEKMKEQMSQLITLFKEQKTENAMLKKAVVEMKREYDITKMDDKIIAMDRQHNIKNWHADRGSYGK